MHFIVAKEDILSLSTRDAENAVASRLAELVSHSKTIEQDPSYAQESDDTLMKNVNMIWQIADLEFSIDGYNDDPRELEDIPEVKLWAETWLTRQNFAPLFLNQEGLVLLMLLVLGSTRVGDMRFPNVESQKLSQFLAHVEAGWNQLVSQYSQLFLTIPFADTRKTIIENTVESIRKKRKPRWKFW